MERCPVCAYTLTDIPDAEPSFTCSGMVWGDPTREHEPTEMSTAPMFRSAVVSRDGQGFALMGIMCTTCGAFIGDARLHTTYHQEQK